MRKNSIFLWVAFIGLTISSCSNNTEITTDENVEKCLYSYDDTSSKVSFKAYKFLSKVGVGGAFDNFTATNTTENEDALQVLQGLSFEIPISGLNTNDPGRDVNISTFFFQTINTDKITGKVVSLSPNGEASLEITLNDITNIVVGHYTLEEEVNFNFEAEIDVNEWNAEKGIEALNEACKDLHTDIENGDTESKLWSEVAISFTTTLKKECN